jgi:GalNAc-alpha-(1->4)-GalNAc-alpha-(1->3)-diNAcBac-PP-undecaprenol alpha-1,4-N-acetyl-D-galactosaminyltransferase
MLGEQTRSIPKLNKYKIMFTVGTMGNGGAERVVSVLANRFVEEGHQVLITQLYSHKCDYELNSRIKLNCVAPDGSQGMTRSIKTITLLRDFLKAERPDVIISFLANVNIYTIIASRGLGIPVIGSERNDPKREPSKFYLKVLRLICYSFVDGIVFQTKDAQQYFSKVIQKKSTIIANPIVVNLPEPYKGEREKNIVSVCRLSSQKNLKLLIDSFEIFYKNNRDYRLIIFGEGEQREELECYINDINASNRISLPGFMKNVHEKIVNSSMFILSSDYEGMPNSLLEAMAMGLPCISTDCPIGGPRQFIESYENGILVPVNDKEALSEAMIMISNNKNMASKFGENAVSIKNELAVELVVEQWMRWIDDCSKK